MLTELQRKLESKSTENNLCVCYSKMDKKDNLSGYYFHIVTILSLFPRTFNTQLSYGHPAYQGKGPAL